MNPSSAQTALFEEWEKTIERNTIAEVATDALMYDWDLIGHKHFDITQKLKDDFRIRMIKFISKLPLHIIAAIGEYFDICTTWDHYNEEMTLGSDDDGPDPDRQRDEAYDRSLD